MGRVEIKFCNAIDTAEEVESFAELANFSPVEY
jgi:hypothetical protein